MLILSRKKNNQQNKETRELKNASNSFFKRVILENTTGQGDTRNTTTGQGNTRN